MPDSDNVLDSLPFDNAEDDPKKKKKTKLVRRMVKKKIRKKKVKPPMDELPGIEPVDEVVDELPSIAVDDAMAPADWDETEDDAADVVEPAGVPVLAFMDNQDGDYDAKGPEKAVEDVPPTPTGEGAGDVLESSVMASESREEQTPPNPVETADTAARADAQPAAGDTQRLTGKWDEFLVAMTSPTRLIIWEMGVASLVWFTTKSREDLMPPYSKLTSGQLDEVESWLNQHGVYLAVGKEKSPVPAAGQQGVTILRGSIRVQNKKLATVETGKQTRGQQRNARMARRRLTM